MNLFGIGPGEFLLIVILALIVFGPAKLPEIMAQVGKAIGDFRRATSELSDEFNRTIQAEIQDTRAVVEDTRAIVYEAHSTVVAAVTNTPSPTPTAEAAGEQPLEPNRALDEVSAQTVIEGVEPAQTDSRLAHAYDELLPPY